LIALYHLQQHNYEEAQRFAEQANEAAIAHGIDLEEGAAQRVLGQIYAALEELDKAKKCFDRSMKLLQTNPYELQQTHDALASCLPT